MYNRILNLIESEELNLSEAYEEGNGTLYITNELYDAMVEDLAKDCGIPGVRGSGKEARIDCRDGEAATAFTNYLKNKGLDVSNWRYTKKSGKVSLRLDPASKVFGDPNVKSYHKFYPGIELEIVAKQGQGSKYSISIPLDDSIEGKFNNKILDLKLKELLGDHVDILGGVVRADAKDIEQWNKSYPDILISNSRVTFKNIKEIRLNFNYSNNRETRTFKSDYNVKVTYGG